jgi:hypothetical protein
MEKPKSVEEIISSATTESQKLIRRILSLEKDKLYMSRPRGMVEDIICEIKKEIK